MFGNNHYVGKLLKTSLPSLPADFFKTQVVGRFKAIAPTVLIFNVSYKCDSKCVMCNSWKLPYHDDMTTDEYRKAFSSELFRSVEYVGITGGEPTLRKDMVDIVRIMADNMPKLRKMTLNTNGFVKDRVVSTLERIIDVANERGFLFGTRVSLDGVGEAHEDIRRVWHAFERAMETVRAMQELQKKKFFNFGVSFTFTAQNLEEGNRIYELCKKENLSVVFAIARYSELAFGNMDLVESTDLKEEDFPKLVDFFRKRVRESGIADGDALLYQAYVKMFQNGMKRAMPCPSMDQGLLLNPNGEITYCENSRVIGNVRDGDPKDFYYDKKNLAMRQEVLDKVCPTCASPCFVNTAAMKRVFPYLRFVAELGGAKIAARFSQSGNGA
ncbi:MAG: radical SAM protein [Acidobacteria bacterium]|nr:MAG: radical SAM protein [Acidobacteriota bacterium]